MRTDYSEWSRSDLIKEIEKLRKRKKYGVVWEDKPEEVAELCKRKLPVLTQDRDREILTDKGSPVNILIEGDNFHALSVLNYTHKGQIDVIYIDPPFNTGSRTWKYNNDYVEKEDEFRHSKWLSFMDKRLRLAKNLLKTSGIIVIAIDDYEMHTLRLLMDEIFGENNRLGTIVVVHNPRGRNDDKYFATMHEYMVVYGKNADFASVGYFDLTEEDLASFNMTDEISAYNLTSFMRTGNNSDRSTRPKLFYPIHLDPETGKLSIEKKGDSIELLPINSSGEEKTWRWGQETFLKKKDTDLVVKEVKGVYRIFKKRRVTNLKGKKPRTVWYNPRYDASSHGIMVLQKMFGQKNVFPYPKSIWTNYDILKLVTKKDSTVLDFFAGSGTAGHAVLMLNKQDGGNRQFILCTNDESEICTEVCYPRIKKVVLGYTNPESVSVSGLGGNLKYFSTDFVDAEPTDKNKKSLVDKSTEMLCLKEGCFEETESGRDFRIFTDNHGKNLGVVYDDDGIEPFKEIARKAEKKFVVYVFSLDESAREDEFEDMRGLVELKPIPAVILNVYRRIFR
jgi:adenine-specific DNA-methyltransferase